MSYGHSEVSFNQSCLKVPVNSLSQKPAPKYERGDSAKNTLLQKDKADSSPDLINMASVKKYLEFYESIPDYSELHHLSNEEFYCRLKSLKITQKQLSNESSIWSSVNSEDDFSNGKYSYDCCIRNRHKDMMKKYKSDCIYLPDKKHHKLDKSSFGGKQRPPKINIISDNENASELYEADTKKNSDYEADQESSTLQVGEKQSMERFRNCNDDYLLENCSKRSRSLPVSPGCECESLECCHGICNVTYRNGCRNTNYSNSKQSSLKKVKKSLSRPVPLTSRIPLYDKIMMEKEARRKIMHDLYSEELRSLVKPFSFTKREEQKEKLKMISSNPELTSLHPPYVRFKAKPVPKNLFSDYAYERMKEDEFYRALKRRVRAEEMLKSASLPPSMALRERQLRSKSLDFLNYCSSKRTWSKLCGYKRACKNIKNEIDFDLNCARSSPHKKKHKFSWLSNTRRINSTTDSSTEVSPYESALNTEKSCKSRPHSAFSSCRNNLAAVLRIETARKRLEKEMEEKLREARLKDQAKFKAQLTRMDPAWKALSYDKNEDWALRMTARREEEREKKEKHKKLMETIYGRVFCMPPLFHKERFFSRKNSLQNSNIKGNGNFSFKKTTNDVLEEQKELKTLKSFKYSRENEDNCRSRESSEYAACEKNEEVKGFESDGGTNET